MKTIKRIALVAHDNRKKDLIEWVEWNWNALLNHKLICTGTTGSMVEAVLREKLDKDQKKKIDIRKLKSGPLGGGPTTRRTYSRRRGRYDHLSVGPDGTAAA